MKRETKRLAKQTVAITVVIVVLFMVEVPVAVIFFLTGVAFLVWRIARRSELRETNQVFAFYLAADEVLRSDQKHWYGFEVAELIGEGEQILESMPDPPPLCHFAVGALCYRIGKYQMAAAQLARVMESDWVEERRLATPSPQLRRYVEMLRAIEREPATSPQVLGAVRSLERIRQKSAAQWLAESRHCLATQSTQDQPPLVQTGLPYENTPLKSIVAPPPISDVLHQLYDE